MKTPPFSQTLRGTASLAVISLCIGFAMPASALTLTNGPGDGTLSVGVDDFGSFGFAIALDEVSDPIAGTGTDDAFFNPVGPVGASPTTFESGIAIGFGGGRTFMTLGDIGGSTGSGTAVTTGISGSPTSATSAFTFGGLSIALTQTLTAILSGPDQTGTELTQVYTITNESGEALDFDIVRYFDGDLRFDGSLIDGGGRLVEAGTETLFETDRATGAVSSTTFVGITGVGGTSPATGRYEIDDFTLGHVGRIIAGTDPDNIITGDGGDADEFIDAGNGFDVTLALRNTFSLLDDATTTYTTRTIFGGAPEETTEGPPGGDGPPGTGIPEPGTLALFGLGLGALGITRRRRLKK